SHSQVRRGIPPHRRPDPISPGPPPPLPPSQPRSPPEPRTKALRPEPLTSFYGSCRKFPNSRGRVCRGSKWSPRHRVRDRPFSMAGAVMFDGGILRSISLQALLIATIIQGMTADARSLASSALLQRLVADRAEGPCGAHDERWPTNERSWPSRRHD